MRIITFLKNQRKERLPRKIDELKAHSAYCLEMSCYFYECAELVDIAPNLCCPNPYPFPYSFFWNINYCSDSYTSFYNEYLRFLFMHNRAEAKIKNLEKRLEEL